MPVASMYMRESPLNPVQGETVRDSWIFVDVLIIVIVHELVSEGLTKDDPDNSKKKNTDQASDDSLTGGARRRPHRRAATRDFFPPDRLWHEKGEIRKQSAVGWK